MNRIQKTISPIDGSVYVERELASQKQIENVLDKASNAQPIWQNTTLSERAEICKKMIEYMLDNVDAIAEELTWQMGRPIRYTPYEITGGLQERAKYMISIAEEALADIQAQERAGFTRFIRRVPLGIVFVIAPWNYPYLTSINSIIPALMAGNTIILKHSEQTPLVAERYTEAFSSAGIPSGVFQHLHITHEDVATIIRDDRINFIAFTGSVAGGRAIQKAASDGFIGAGLELGGKDPAYIRSDANLNFTIESVIDGSFFNSGQSCCGIERIYVHEAIYNDFIDGAIGLTKQYILDNPLNSETTLGPMVRTRSANVARRQIAEAVSQGAKPLIDPALFPNAKNDTPYLEPQILVNVNHDMRVMREESFAPIVGIMKVRNDEEAIQLMNDSEFGLTASIWTEDIDRALGIGEQVNTGTWYMNRCDYLDPELAWTGIKNSGRGCTLSVLGYESLTRPKSFHLRTTLSS